MDNILIISDFPEVQYKKDSGTPALRLIVEDLAKKYSVHVILPYRHGEERSRYPGAKHHYYVMPVPSGNFISRKMFALLFPQKAFRIAKNLNNIYKFKFKFVYGAGCNSVTAAGMLTKELGIPSIGRLFGTYLLPYLHDPIRLAIKFEEVRAFKSSCTKFIITDDGTGGNFVASRFGIPKEKLYFWKNGVEVPPDQPARADGIVHIISLARLDRWKRVDRIINSFADIENGEVLDIVGDGPERENLQRLVDRRFLHSKVNFYGEVTRKQALEMLAKSDVFVSTNDYSNVSNSLLEAMAAGKCIVVFDTGMTRETVEDGITGFVASSEERFTEALYRAVVGKRTRRVLGESAKEYAKAHFISWNERIAKEVAACQDLVEKSR